MAALQKDINDMNNIVCENTLACRKPPFLYTFRSVVDSIESEEKPCCWAEVESSIVISCCLYDLWVH